jgi:hypothetical protein
LRTYSRRSPGDNGAITVRIARTESGGRQRAEYTDAVRGLQPYDD